MHTHTEKKIFKNMYQQVNKGKNDFLNFAHSYFLNFSMSVHINLNFK